MATALITVDGKLFQMMPYITILKVRKFHQPTANSFSTARKKPVGGGGHIRLVKVNVSDGSTLSTFFIFYQKLENFSGVCNALRAVVVPSCKFLLSIGNRHPENDPRRGLTHRSSMIWTGKIFLKSQLRLY